MGGKSSSSNTTHTTNVVTSGQSHVDGDNTGVILSGVNNSRVSLSVTDHGAVSAALKAMSETAADAFGLGRDAIESNEAVSKLAIGEMSDLSQDIVNKALVSAEGATSAALDVAKNLTLSSDAGSAQQMTKYVALSLAAVGVAAALRGGFK
ncbi:hypothetical protein O1O06_11870 [Grimontia hollisae]|uniref:hypothetical protein n=1 Tax=Grimontia hollisae TaxID=673 RepID=UPI0023DA3370|nr:hypothetical protein [Grimontia hollisae]MDF2185460.1 hypothetical protein [Grimontia hollisae]